MIRVLVIDDSVTMREIMRRALTSVPGIEVAGFAADGGEGLAAARRLRPDLITMDILMPVMNGLEAARRIMEEVPAPIVMVSAIGDSEEQRISFEAMEAGAVWVVKKPKGNVTADWTKWAESLVAVVKSMAQVKVISRARSGREPQPKTVPVGRAPAVAAIAASTGGPTVVKDILMRLPGDYPLPILVCQHITAGFVHGLADWLKGHLALPVRIAPPSGPLRPGVTLAPDNGHLELAARDQIAVRSPDGDTKYLPSADRLLASAARHLRERAVGIILTGMGRDGAQGLKDVADAGGITVGQDEASSLIYGMPRAAVEIGAVQHQMDPEQIADFLRQLPAGTRAG